jgi:hypothetical protein
MKLDYGRNKSTLQGIAGLAFDVIIDCTLANVGRRLGRTPVNGEIVSRTYPESREYQVPLTADNAYGQRYMKAWAQLKLSGEEDSKGTR